MTQRKLTPEEQKRAGHWNNKWPKERIVYNAQYNRPRDVRTFLFKRSFILEDIVNNHKLIGKDDNETMYRILMFVMNNVRYVGDMETKGQAEFWQNPEDTITLKTGDCEDMSILVKSLSLVAGVPDYKVKIGCGAVKGGGHAYPLYLRDDDTWCILDACYWPNRLSINKRKKFADEENYYNIWFSFSYEYSFASQARKYGPNGG